MSKRLGVIRHAYAKPLFAGLEQTSPESEIRFELVQDVPTRLVTKLLQDELAGAFVTPIEYAKHHTQLRILGGVCLASHGETHTIELHFRDNLRSIDSLAINPESSSEIILAKSILTEKFNCSPQLLAVQRMTPEVLKKSDSVLVVGDDCIEWEDHHNRIDLVDEWFDITEYPYVHGFWVTKEHALTPEEVKRIQENVLQEEYLPIEFSFAFDEAALASLEEYYKIAFYYGILKEVPDIQFLEALVE